jgi:DNA-binding XRE family transcriptional regulator
MPTSGPELRRERRAAEITTVALAAEINLSRASLYTLEQSAVVSPERVAAYREAVKALTAAKASAA